jgi:hypothetical protein
MTDHETRSDGLQLLRVMNETQACGSEEVPVTPALAAHDAGLEIGSERYAAAMHFLRNEGALVVHPFGEQSVGDYERGGGPYYITQRGFMMLEEAKGSPNSPLRQDRGYAGFRKSGFREASYLHAVQ